MNPIIYFMKADLCQEINRGFAFSRGLNEMLFWRKFSILSLARNVLCIYVLTESKWLGPNYLCSCTEIHIFYVVCIAKLGDIWKWNMTATKDIKQALFICYICDCNKIINLSGYECTTESPSQWQIDYPIRHLLHYQVLVRLHL